MLQYTAVLPATLELLKHLMQKKSLTDFEDADEDANPKVFTKIDWEQVKKQIEKEVHKLLC